jgi:hypothetical protein
VPEAERAWLALDFDDPVKRWVREYKPRLTAIRSLRDWIRSREADPFQGVRLVPGFDNLMFGIIPGTMDDDGRVVTCSYWVYRADRILRCDMISTASWPV